MSILDANLFADTPIFQQMIRERSGRAPGTLARAEIDIRPGQGCYRPVMWDPRWRKAVTPVVHLGKKS